MRLLKILGGAVKVATALNPALAPVVGIVNRVLPKDRQLPENASGQEVAAAYESLSPAEQMRIDAECEQAGLRADTEQLQAMVSVETATANTRPQIAVMMAHLIVWATAAMIGLLLVALVLSWHSGDTALLVTARDSWPLVGTMLAPAVSVVLSYFGKRTREKKARYAAASGQDIVPPGIGGAIAALIAGRK